MAGSAGDLFADLNTSPIFDDAVYFSEALLLSATENEDHLDAQLAMAAELSDIEQPYKILALHPDPDLAPAESELPAILTSTSALSLHSEQRSSVSIRSQETQSTGRTSHDHPSLDVSHTHRKTPSFSRASVSTDRAGYLMDPFLRSGVQHKNSTSSFSAANSVFSSSSSTRERSVRKPKRASAIFSKFKRTSSIPTSRSHRESRLGEEVDIVIQNKSNTFPSPDVESLRDSGYSEDGASSLDLPRGPDIETDTMHTFLSVPETMQADEELISIDPMECDNFRSLRNEQREQYQRISLFESNQRKALAVHHHWFVRRLEARSASLEAFTKQQHPADLDRLEELQLKAEHELRKTQATETQNVATALKHMTAYCSGFSPVDTSLAHKVTDEDRKNLERQRLIQKKLPAKHESQINVLRAKQERDMKNRVEKHKLELEQISLDLENDKNKERIYHARELARLETTIKTRRQRIMKRWDLRYEMWRKDWEKQKSESLPGRIPQEDEWPTGNAADVGAGSLILESSALAVYNGALTGMLMELGNKSLESSLRRGGGSDTQRTTTYEW